MSLPLVFDIAIGVVFIYLILSLLASEIQELISTLLQWRAVHLRKSIEILLTGGEDTPEEDSVKQIVDDLYSNPLVRNINQESKGGIAAWFRQIVWQVGRLYRTLANKKTTSFGQEVGRDGNLKERRSAPSYIPSETFATTLLSRLNIATLSQKLRNINFINLKDQEILVEIETNILSHLKVSEVTRLGLESEFNTLKKNLDKILINFQNNKFTLIDSLDRMGDELGIYIENSEIHFTDYESNSRKEFINAATSLKQDLFINKGELIKRLEPSLTQIVDILDKGGNLYKEFRESTEDKTSELYKAYAGIEEEIQQVIEKLPKSARESLSTLAKRAQINADKVENELNQFKKEVEVWFDRSMDRASGVYKRNAKGVAFLIGSFLAFSANADTFHIVSRLSRDTPLREAIIQNAGQVAGEQNCPNFNTQDQPTSQSPEQPLSKLDCIRNQVNQTLKEVSLPIGRSSDNLEQQQDESKEWFFPPLKRVLGWAISGLAISMGARFWFELLGKIMNVRNTGPKPASSIEERSSSK
jgi:gas vesicle protein